MSNSSERPQKPFVLEINNFLADKKNRQKSANSEMSEARKKAFAVWKEAKDIVENYGADRSGYAIRPIAGVLPIVATSQLVERKETPMEYVDLDTKLRLQIRGTREQGGVWNYTLYALGDGDIYPTRVASINSGVIRDGNRHEVNDPRYIHSAIENLGRIYNQNQELSERVLGISQG